MLINLWTYQMSGGNICFSKDGTFYGASDMFLITEGGESMANENLFICQRDTSDDDCELNNRRSYSE